jgi:hypothetical protein
MSKRSCTPLTQAALLLDSHPAALRKTVNRFGIVERDGRQRVIPNDVLALFRRTKAVSGYLYPSWVRSHADLIAAAAEIPSSEIESYRRLDSPVVNRLGADRVPRRQCKRPGRHEN